jgi:hypothetical protein
MLRRQVIKSLTALGTLALLPKWNYGTDNTTLSFHFVGLGSAGTNMSEHFYMKSIVGEFTYITSQSRSYLPDDFRHIHFEAHENSSWQFDNNILTDEITNVFKNNHHYVLLAGIGKKTGTLLTSHLISYLNQNKKTFSVICSLPFQFEGEKINRRAADFLFKHNNSTNLKTYPLQQIIEQQPDLPLRKVMEVANDGICDIYNQITKTPKYYKTL